MKVGRFLELANPTMQDDCVVSIRYKYAGHCRNGSRSVFRGTRQECEEYMEKRFAKDRKAGRSPARLSLENLLDGWECKHCGEMCKGKCAGCLVEEEENKAKMERRRVVMAWMEPRDKTK